MTFQSIELNEGEERVYFYPGTEKTIRRKANDIPLSNYLAPFIWIGKILFLNHLANRNDMEAYWLSDRGRAAGTQCYTKWVKWACNQLCNKALTPAMFRRMFMTYAMKLTMGDSKKVAAIAKLQNTSPSVVNFYYNRQNASEENRAVNSDIIMGLGLFADPKEFDSDIESPQKKQKTTEINESPEAKRITEQIHYFVKAFWEDRTPFEFTKTYYNSSKVTVDLDSEEEEEISDTDSEEEEDIFLASDAEFDSDEDIEFDFESDKEEEEEEEEVIDFTAQANQCCQSFTIQLEPCVN